MATIRCASINGGSEKARYGDMVQFNGPDGRLITGAVTDIHRSHGTTYLELDDTYQVEAWHARAAQPVARIKPGSHVTLRADVVSADGQTLLAGTTLEILSWRAGHVMVVDKNNEFFSVHMVSLVLAAWPTVPDIRLIRWERSRP